MRESVKPLADAPRRFNRKILLRAAAAAFLFGKAVLQ
jgi:hypothetical protein